MTNEDLFKNLERENILLKRRNTELEIQSINYKNLLKFIPGSIYLKDFSGTYLWTNEFARNKMSSLNLESQVIGKNDYELFDKAIANEYRKNDLLVMTTGEEISIEETVDLDAKRLGQISIKRPVFNESDMQVIGVIGATIDISDRKNYEDKILLEKQEAEALNNMKTDFLMSVEHDLRNPCANMKGFLDILAYEETNPQKKEKIRNLVKLSELLLYQINGLLDFDAITKGFVPNRREMINIKEMFRQIVEAEEMVAKKKDIKFDYYYDDRNYSCALIDQYKITRSLVNFLENAMKFSPRFSTIKIRIIITDIDEQNSEGTLNVAIADSGIGISKSNLDHVFEKFFKVEKSYKSANYKGSGLGLSIVKKFIDDLGGTVAAESTLGKGSTFSFKLRVKIAKSLNTDLANETDELKKLNSVLIVDDDLLSLEIAKNFMNRYFNVTTIDAVDSGQKCLDLVLEQNKTYDVLFIDIGLNDSSGIDIARKILAHKKLRQEKIILLSANSMMSVGGLISGMDVKLITKPIDRTKYKEIVEYLNI